MNNNAAAAVHHAESNLSSEHVQAQVNTLATTVFEWVGTHWMQVALAAGAGVLIFLLLHALRSWGMKLCEKSPSVTGWGTIIGRTIARTGNFFILMTSIKLVESYAQTPELLSKTINFLFTLAAVFQAAIWARELILSSIEYRTQSDEHRGEALGSAMGIIRLLVTFALFAIALIVVLDNLGVNVTGLVAGLGVGGIAIGLAAQGIFADLFAALAIIFDRPFRRGDVIAYSGSGGTVEAIGLKSTRVRAPTGEERIISNKKLLDNEILNNSRRKRRRVHFNFGLLYQTAPQVAAQMPALLKEIVEGEKQKFVKAGFVEFTDNYLKFEVEFDSPSPKADVAEQARHQVGMAIFQRFHEMGIHFFAPALPPETAALLSDDEQSPAPDQQESGA